MVVIILPAIYTKASNEDVIIIPNNSLRFRVVASTNSLEDYKIKEKVKKALEQELTELLKSAKTLSETKELISSNYNYLDNIVKKTLETFDVDYNINFGINYFPKKIYKGIVYEAGDYDSLVITIGKGLGENWWCVLFPPLCLLEDNENTSDVEYQFFISRIIAKFK